VTTENGQVYKVDGRADTKFLETGGRVAIQTTVFRSDTGGYMGRAEHKFYLPEAKKEAQAEWHRRDLENQRYPLKLWIEKAPLEAIEKVLKIQKEFTSGEGK